MKLQVKTENIKFEELIKPITAHYFHEKNKKVERNPDEIDLLNGSDFSSVYAVQDFETVEKFINLLTKKDMNYLYEEMSMNHIPVYEINNIFLISVELDIEDTSNAAVNFLRENSVGFGAYSDDVTIGDCYMGLIQNYKNYEEMSTDYKECKFEDDSELESSIDSFLRIWEYTENKELFLPIMQKLKPMMKELWEFYYEY